MTPMVILLSILILPLVTSSVHSKSKSNNQQSIHYEAIKNIINNYKQTHNINRFIDSDSRPTGSIKTHSSFTSCNKETIKDVPRIIIGYYHCPDQIGNRVMEFLNSFAIAIIANRTLVWKFCQGLGRCSEDSSVETCDRVMRRKPWMISYDEIKQLYNYDECDIMYAPEDEYSIAFYSWLKSFVFTRPTYDDLLASARGQNYDNSDQSHRWAHLRHINASMSKWQFTDSALLLSCSHIDTNPMLKLTIGPNERVEALYLTYKDALLQPAARERARILFALGGDYIYGKLFHEAFDFTSELSRMNEGITVSSPLPGSLYYTPTLLSSHFTTSILTQNEHTSTHTPHSPSASSSAALTHNENLNETLIIGVHIRNQQRDDMGDLDRGEAASICNMTKAMMSTRRIVHHNNHNTNPNNNNNISSIHERVFSQCMVILASDRPLTIQRNERWIRSELGKW